MDCPDQNAPHIANYMVGCDCDACVRALRECREFARWAVEESGADVPDWLTQLLENSAGVELPAYVTPQTNVAGTDQYITLTNQDTGFTERVPIQPGSVSFPTADLSGMVKKPKKSKVKPKFVTFSCAVCGKPTGGGLNNDPKRYEACCDECKGLPVPGVPKGLEDETNRWMKAHPDERDRERY